MTADFGKYEAEHATLVDCDVSADNSASNLSEVVDTKQGSSLSFANVIAGTSVDVRYCTMNSPGKLSPYVNGTLSQTVSFPSTMSWSGSYATVNATVNVPVAVPKGGTLKLQYDAGGSSANIDFIQVK